MTKKPWQRIDVNLLGDITKKEYCEDANSGNPRNLLEIIQRIHSIEIIISGLDLNKRKEFDKINIKEFGFRERNDVKFDMIPDVFACESKITMIPKTVYYLEDKIILPDPFSKKGEMWLSVMADAFERLKVKAENILHSADNFKNIELYAVKNIQMARRMCYESKVKMEKIQKHGSKEAMFIVYIQNLFIINVLMYMQNMFSNFYSEEVHSKYDLKLELFETMNMGKIMEPEVDYIKKTDNTEKEMKFKWNGQINTLVTYLYDLMNMKIDNEFLLETTNNDVVHLLTNFFVDKNGNPMKESTVSTCLKDGKVEKRVKGKKRIEIK
ncbi:MAG: hypothetical protein A2W91_05435 [Bacteroidetes bacterium GWF2_38_335]|nr:MAG: hypothetical protein A2W91_05435 [Bacteroidetes bacterium GWF2_38_335]HBS88114.1 hypothetical protein [Bacteroidales bacterium]